MYRSTTTVLVSALLGLTGVAIGAFGAHGLPSALQHLAPEAREHRLEVLETGSRYQMYHALTLLAVASLQKGDGRPQRWFGPVICFVGGTLLFSGSLYALALTGVTRWGMVTPVGGLAWLVGWSWLAVVAVRAPRS